jgi:anti-sigma factor RsiW
MSWWRRGARGGRPGCMQILPQLQAFVDGEVDGRTAQEVADHLRDCRRCGLEASVYRELQASLRRQVRVPKSTLAQLEEFVRALDGQAPPDRAVSRHQSEPDE